MALKKVSSGLNQSKEILYPNVIYIELFMLILDQKKNTRSVLRGTKKTPDYTNYFTQVYIFETHNTWLVDIVENYCVIH